MKLFLSPSIHVTAFTSSPVHEIAAGLDGDGMRMKGHDRHCRLGAAQLCRVSKIRRIVDLPTDWEFVKYWRCIIQFRDLLDWSITRYCPRPAGMLPTI